MPDHPPAPVIVGAPRSGTTLLRFMLDAHPELAIPPETGFLTQADRLAGMSREGLFETVTGHPPECPAWEDFGLPAVVYREALATLEPFTAGDGVRAFYRLYARAHGKALWGDKTPVHTFHLEAIGRLLPEARFIHIVRDGRDACLSWRRTWFSPGDEIRTVAAEWQRFVLAARQGGEAGVPYLEVRYEDVVLEPEATLRSICEFLELRFDRAMLRYHERVPQRLREHKGKRWRDGSGRVVTREQRLAQQRLTRFPPEPSRVQAWRTEMSPEEQRAFVEVAGETLRSLGYTAEVSLAARA